VNVPIRVFHVGYRVAYTGLRIYWFAARPEVDGVKCVLTNGPRVLLVRHSYGPREWVLPGGSIKRRERPVNAARREMAEELGLTIDHWESLGEVHGRMQYRHDRLHCFQAEVGDARVVPDQRELVAANWFSGDELPADAGRYVRPILRLAR
jgi:8-oxo-dGTP pyrophosphatase MutT (NUDIX family)